MKLCPGKKQIAAMADAVQYMSERRQKRFARFKQEVAKYWRLYPWMMFAAMCICTSCKHTQYIVPNDTTTTTTTTTKAFERDSVYCYDKDSMAITLRQGAHVGSDPRAIPDGRTLEGQTLMCYPCRVDTMVVDRWHTHYKDRWLTRTDTLIQKDTTVVTQTITQTQTKEVKHVPKFYKWCAGILILLIIALIGKVIYKVWLKKYDLVAIIKKALTL